MKLSVISFNIRNCDDPGGYSVAERAPRLSAITSQYNADIIGFQEYRPTWEPYIKKYYSDEYDIFLKYRFEAEKNPEATPILWKKDKFDCINAGYFWLSDTPDVESRGWDEVFNCYRICIYVILKDKQSGKSFTVMNTHFGFGDKGQVSSVNLIYEYSKKISDLPTLIIGDFNMTPDSAGYAATKDKFIDVNVKTANDLGCTYHGYKPEKIINGHIDYCFVDDNIIPINQKIIKDLIDYKYPSDHYGLYNILEIQ